RLAERGARSSGTQPVLSGRMFTPTGRCELLRSLQATAGTRVPQFFAIATNAALAGDCEKTSSINAAASAGDHQHVGENDSLSVLTALPALREYCRGRGKT